MADSVTGVRRVEYVLQMLEVRFRFAGAQQCARKLRLRQKVPVGESSLQQKGQAEILRI